MALVRVLPFCLGAASLFRIQIKTVCCCTRSGAQQCIDGLFAVVCRRFHRTAEEQRLAAEARRSPSVVIDREARRQLLNYFVFCPPENDKKGDKTGSINAISSSSGSIGRGSVTQQESDAIGSSGRGARFSKSVRDVFSRLPTLNNPTPDPPPLPGATSPPSALASPLPTSPDIEEASGVNAQESSSTGECEVRTVLEANGVVVVVLARVGNVWFGPQLVLVLTDHTGSHLA